MPDSLGGAEAIGVMDAGEVSFVIPVYKSEDCLSQLVRRIRECCEAHGCSYEIVLVNDCSPDGSWQTIVDVASGNPRVRGINLRRNFGQDCALMAGLRHARGEVVIIMDDDLQHDPADAMRLVAEVRQGHDVCYARFRRKKQAWWKNAGSWLNDRLAVLVLDKPKDVYMSPYKAIVRSVVAEVLNYKGPYPYVDGLIFGVTRSITQIDVEHHDRYSGEGNFGLRKSISTWLRLATSFSVTPLRLATCLGFLFSAIGLLAAAIFVIRNLVGIDTPMGWASLFVGTMVLGGVQLACLGIIGEYLGRAFLHLNKRPQYVICEICAFEGTGESP